MIDAYQICLMSIILLVELKTSD